MHRGSVGATARAKAPEPDSAAVAAATAARRKARRQRQQHAPQRGYADEFAYLTSELDPDPEVSGSDRGAGSLGFAGTLSRDSVQPAGLITLAGDPFGGGPTLPMVPTTWDSDLADEA